MLQERGAALYEVLRHVRPLTLNSARVVQAALTPLGLTVGMRAVLEVLDTQGPTPVPGIAAHLDLTRQGVQRHVDELVQRGWVRTDSNPAHRRSVLIALTDTGRSGFAELRAQELDQLGRLADGCTAEEIAVAAKVLRELSSDIRARAMEQRVDASGADR